MEPSPGRKGTNKANLQSTDHWFQTAVRYLARFDRTAKQVEQFLKAKGASLAQARRTVERLLDLRYIDDRAYADRWLESRLARLPMGPERLRAELLSKGLTEAVVEEAIRTRLGDIDEDTLARRALQITQRRGLRLSLLQASRLLHRWGFAEDTVTRIIRDYHEGTFATNEQDHQ